MLVATGCSNKTIDPVSVGVRPHQVLPAPDRQLVPTINIARIKDWPDTIKLEVAEGLAVAVFAADLEHPSWLYVLPKGNVLVAESNVRTGGTGIKGWIARQIMSRAGTGVPSANQITLLRDSGSDAMPISGACLSNN